MPQQNQQGGQQQPQQSQPNVRVIPIFVEGRDQPVINKDLPDSSSTGSIPDMSSGQQFHHQMPPRQEMPRMTPQMDFDDDMPSFSRGSIFDRAKDFPVRRNFPTAQEFFAGANRGASPSRESPIRQVPINHMNEPAFSSPFHNHHQQPQQPQFQRQQPSPTAQFHQQQQQQPRSRTSSRNSEEPQVEARQIPVQRQSPAPQQHQQQQQQPPKVNQEPQKEPSLPPQQPQPKPGPIDKIQKIQKDVLDLMTKVEQFNGKTKKDKEYIYLDEMLTQNLLRLDDVETEGKENVKLARREAVKCINRCLSVLEAKAEAAEQQPNMTNEQQQPQQQQQPESNNMETNNEDNQNKTEAMEVDPSNNAEKPPSKQSSRTSIYDNHDPNASGSNIAEQQQKQPESKEGTPKPGSKESTPVSNTKEQTPPVTGEQEAPK